MGEQETKAASTREYVVLQREGSSSGWEIREHGYQEGIATQGDGTYTASTDLQAIKLAIAEHGEGNPSSDWVAVPARSWRERRRSVETKTVERWA